MKDVISFIVVAVFLAIVFKKRFFPFLKSRKDRAVKQETVNALPDKLDQSYDVILFDVIRYTGNLYDLNDDISMKLEKKLDHIRSNGTLIDVSVYPLGRFLMFLIKWQPLSGGKEAVNG